MYAAFRGVKLKKKRSKRWLDFVMKASASQLVIYGREPFLILQKMICSMRSALLHYLQLLLTSEDFFRCFFKATATTWPTMLKTILDKIFKLPPVEERTDIRKGFLTLIRVAVKEKDDVYIYYQFALTSFIFCLFVSGLFFWMYLQKSSFHAGPFQIPFTTNAHYVDFFDEYSKTVKPVLLWAILPFFLFKARWNYNPTKYNVVWFAPAFQDERNKKPSRVLRYAAFAFIAGYFPLGSLGSFWGWAFSFLEHSSLAISGYIFICAWLSAILANLVFLSLIWFWAYLGKFNSRVKK